MKVDAALAFEYVTPVVYAYQLFQPNGTVPSQANLGIRVVFASANDSITVRQSEPKLMKAVGEEILSPLTRPCSDTSRVSLEVTPPNTLSTFSRLFAP